jgi:hypothetical protein
MLYAIRPSLTVSCLLASALLAGAGCASGSAGSSAAPDDRPRATRTRSDLITREEIERTSHQNAYDLVAGLRPRWLRAHGPDSVVGETVEVQVRLDDARVGGPTALRGIAVRDIASIQFVGPVDAAARWGPTHANGAILVTTIRR